jgi:ferredoxin-thioredoxin reductase catalytic subunit
LVDDILLGLAVNEKRYGYKACPCRLATGRYQLDCDIICPCSYCFSDVEKHGRCYCSLFVSDRFISGDPSLPQYVPDSRERSETGGEKTDEIIADVPPTTFKTHIKIIGFMQDEADKNIAKEGFLKIVESFGADVSMIKWHENTAYASTVIEGAKVIVRLKLDADAYTYQISCVAFDGKVIHGEKFFQRIDLARHKNKLFECCIIGAKKNENVYQYLPPEDKRYVSYLYNNYRIVAGFETEGENKDTFIVNTDDDVPDRIVEDIAMLETNYHLVNIEKQRYILAVDKLDQLESMIVAKMGIISMNLPKSQPEALKGWLHGLSNNFGEISGIAEESRRRMNYTILKRDTIRRIVKEWGENDSGDSYPVVSSFFLEKVDNLCDQYQRLFTRIDGIRREMTDLITMLRTKIDLILQEQSLELQRSMDKTTKTQMMMQHTVEGLSVIILSYYTIHLAGFVFESLEASHIIHISLATAKAIFVPVAIAISWFLTFRARRMIKGHSGNKSK